MKQKKNKEPQFILHFGYDNWQVSGGQAEDPNDRWSSRTDAYYDSKVYGIFKNKEFNKAIMWESVEVPEEIYNSDNLYLVVVKYSDGDTFGRSNGHICIADYAISYNEAVRIKDIIINNEKARNENRYCYKKKDMIEMIPYDPKVCGYVKWDGYFNYLDCIEINEYKIKNVLEIIKFYP